jgi:hypothetical protein
MVPLGEELHETAASARIERKGKLRTAHFLAC